MVQKGRSGRQTKSGASGSEVFVSREHSDASTNRRHRSSLARAWLRYRATGRATEQEERLVAKKIREHFRGNVVAYVALFFALGGSAYAVTALDRNSVKSKHIVNDQVKRADLRAGAINSAKVGDDSLRGADVDEATLMGVDAERLGGTEPDGFVRVISSVTVQRDYGSINSHQCRDDAISVPDAAVGDRVEIRTDFVPGFDVFFLGESVEEIEDEFDPFPTPQRMAQWKYCNLRDSAVDPSGTNIHVTVLRP